LIESKVKQLQGKLIVSCQALPHEPLHSSFIMGRMALAAKEGGALGIRANTKEDIQEIQTQVDLPVIGIVKRDYEDSTVYITPTMKEIDELMEVKPEIIALDATGALRPGGVTLDDFFHQIKDKYPDQLWMADCSTVEEALHADELGFDFIGTTMVGYTPQSQGDRIEENDFEIMRKIIANVKHRVIAEGNINTPQKAKRVIELGAFSVVVGSIITRPQLITKAFAQALEEENA
jgi:N-acylglucosamine-6-phosphate 2-epimerase